MPSGVTFTGDADRTEPRSGDNSGCRTGPAGRTVSWNEPDIPRLAAGSRWASERFVRHPDRTARSPAAGALPGARSQPPVRRPRIAAVRSGQMHPRGRPRLTAVRHQVLQHLPRSRVRRHRHRAQPAGCSGAIADRANFRPSPCRTSRPRRPTYSTWWCWSTSMHHAAEPADGGAGTARPSLVATGGRPDGQGVRARPGSRTIG